MSDGEAKGGEAAAEPTEFALDGRLIELENPVLHNIARQADLQQTLVALERTSHRLRVASKNANVYAPVRQFRFGMECDDTGLHACFSTFPKVGALGHGFKIRLTMPMRDQGEYEEGLKKRLDGLLEHLLCRGARPSSIRVGDLVFEPAKFFAPSLTRLMKDRRLPVLKGLIQEHDYNLSSKPHKRCNHEEVFAKRLPQLLGLFCGSICCQTSLHKYPSLLYASMDVSSYTTYCERDEEWSKKVEAAFLKRLRCLVLKRQSLEAYKGWRREAAVTERIEARSGGHLKLRESYEHQRLKDPWGQNINTRVLAFACEDFDPSELQPLLLGHIWDEGLPRE